MVEIKVFGTRPQNQIFMPQVAFNVRNNCKVGQWTIGEDDYRGKDIEISIIGVCQMFGTLGKTTSTPWLQVWFVPAPSCDVLPRNTVCVTYLKKRSITQFSQKITELMESGEPAMGIFTAGFTKHTGELGDYYSVVWDWRQRDTDEELEQLEMIADFLASEPKLLDLERSASLTPLARLRSDEIAELIAANHLDDGNEHKALAPAS
jgi:hypothetical protein